MDRIIQLKDTDWMNEEKKTTQEYATHKKLI
jgi:hypothetical protein